jgi:hypothetical protein
MAVKPVHQQAVVDEQQRHGLVRVDGGRDVKLHVVARDLAGGEPGLSRLAGASGVAAVGDLSVTWT